MSFMVPIEFASNGATVAQENFDATETRLNRYPGKCRVATAAALAANTRTGNTLTANANASLNTAGIDGVTSLALNDRILIKDEVTQANNGIYFVLDLGSIGTKWKLRRASDADTSEQFLNGLQVWITSGTVNARSAWQLSTADPIVINVSNLVWDQVVGGTASGTVTSFSAGNLSPVFSTSVATPTTTPALSFALTTQTANKVFAGPSSAGPSAPTFRSLVSADIPNLPASIITTGQLSLARGGTGADLSAAANGAFLIKSGSALSATVALVGVVQGNNSSAPTAALGAVGRLARWAATDPYLRDSAVQDDGSTVGIGAAPSAGITLLLGGNQTLSYPPGIVNYGLDVMATGSLASARLFRCGIQGVSNGLTIVQDGSSNLAFSIIGGGLNVGATATISTGVISTSTGYQIAGAAASGKFLRGDGTNFVSASISAVDLPGSFSGFANPTASIGLAAINGAATTAMRSDAAQALSQSIVPTWTGSHIWLKTALGSSAPPTQAISIQNTTAAANGAQQFSPSLSLIGKAWDVSGSLSRQANANLFCSSQQTSGSPNVLFEVMLSANGGQSGRGLAVLQPFSGRADVYAGDRLSAGLTTDTTGFLYITSFAGAPSGVPANTVSEMLPMGYDRTNDALYFYNSAWKKIGTATSGGFGGFANPTASIGLIAVNGSASTAMRSDGAPAIDVSIIPTWTATHTFNLSPRAPTPGLGDNSTKVATTAFVIANLPPIPVSSVFGRTGNIAAATNDYSFAQLSGSCAIGQGGTGINFAGVTGIVIIDSSSGFLYISKPGYDAHLSISAAGAYTWTPGL